MTTWRPRKMLMTVGLQEQVLFPAGGRAIGASASSWSGGPRVTVWRAHISGGADQLGETRVGSALVGSTAPDGAGRAATARKRTRGGCPDSASNPGPTHSKA